MGSKPPTFFLNQHRVANFNIELPMLYELFFIIVRNRDSILSFFNYQIELFIFWFETMILLFFTIKKIEQFEKGADPQNSEKTFI